MKVPGALHSLDEAAVKVGVSAQRLADLADAGFAPHWRIDNGPPLFQVPDLKAWVNENLVVKNEGRGMTRIADDFTAIRARLEELHAPAPDKWIRTVTLRVGRRVSVIDLPGEWPADEVHAAAEVLGKHGIDVTLGQEFDWEEILEQRALERGLPNV
jgi:hypothetical protein